MCLASVWIVVENDYLCRPYINEMSEQTHINNRINALIAAGMSFAMYRLPWKKNIICKVQTMGEVRCLESMSALNDECGFVIAPFVQTENCPLLLIHPDVSATGWEELSEKIERLNLPLPQSGKEISGKVEACGTVEDYDLYAQAFDSFIHPLRNGEFEKLVLSRSLSCNVSNKLSLVDVFNEACDSYPRAFVYLFYTPKTGLWLGSTPEILLSGNKERWHTVALAGTMFIENDRIPREWSEKNKHEQAVVVEYIRKQLASLRIKVEEEGPYTAQAGKLVHLKTDFYFSLPRPDKLGDVLELLHPTPAVCGIPKEKAITFIPENEGYERKYYSGFVGWLEPEGKSDLYVNLRCMNIGADSLTLYAGGGILPSSNVDSEWKETQEKMKTMLKLITKENVF